MATNLQNLSDETRDELAALALKLSNDKKTRTGFLGLVKQAVPETPIPEIDVANAIDERLKGEREEREKFEGEQRQRWLQEDLAKTKRDVKQKFELSDDDLAKMEKMMTEKQLPAQYEWAAPLYKQQVESANPTNYGSGPYEGPLDLERNAQGMEGLMDDPDNWSRAQAHEMIEDMKKKGRASAF